MRRSAALVLTAAFSLVVAACGDGGGGVDAVRASAALNATTTTTLAPVETATSTTALPATTTTTNTSTTVRATTTTRSPATTTTTQAPTPTTQPPVTAPAPRFPGDTRRAAGWVGFTESNGGRTLTFTYFSGPPPCSIEDGIQIEETTAQVRVTIFERDGSAGQPCIALAQQKFATVNLATPLGGRRVVDGARV